MPVKNGTVAFNSTGLTAYITCGFTPDEIELRVGGLFGGGDTDIHVSLGHWTSTLQHTESIFSDGTNTETVSDDTVALNHLEWSGSAIVPVIRGTVNNTNATGFRLNLSAATANYNIFWIARKY